MTFFIGFLQFGICVPPGRNFTEQVRDIQILSPCSASLSAEPLQTKARPRDQLISVCGSTSALFPFATFPETSSSGSCALASLPKSPPPHLPAQPARSSLRRIRTTSKNVRQRPSAEVWVLFAPWFWCFYRCCITSNGAVRESSGPGRLPAAICEG